MGMGLCRLFRNGKAIRCLGMTIQTAAVVAVALGVPVVDPVADLGATPLAVRAHAIPGAMVETSRPGVQAILAKVAIWMIWPSGLRIV